MKVLLTGSTGQLGQSILKIQNQFPAYHIIPLSRADFDLTTLHKITQVLDQHAPDVVINTAAYTAVDKAENDQKLAEMINSQAVKKIGEWCLAKQVKFIHVSTDYVFDGNHDVPYLETDKPNPLTVYGKTKWQGEQALISLGLKNSAIIRTSWVWSEFGNNFVKTMLKLAEQKNEINVVNDQFGSPTYAGDLAFVILKMIEQLDNKKLEIFHYSNAGICSWFEFASAIFVGINGTIKISPIKSELFKTIAKRPAYTAMNSDKIQKEFNNIQLVAWEKSLRLNLAEVIQ